MKVSCAICVEEHNLNRAKKLIDVADIFFKLTSLEVSALNDIQQLKICEPCHQKLVDYDTFRALCVGAHAKLIQGHEELSKLHIIKFDEVEVQMVCAKEEYDSCEDQEAPVEEASFEHDTIAAVVVKEESHGDEDNDDDDEYDDDIDDDDDYEDQLNDTVSDEPPSSPAPKKRGRKKGVPGKGSMTNTPKLVVNRRLDLSCHLCEEKFRSQVRLEGHLRQHKGLKPAVCKECGKEFVMWRSLRRHVKEKHLKEGLGHFPCDYEGCTFAYNTLKGLQAHKKKHLPGWVKPVPKKCVCETCGKTFSSCGSLKKHNLIHTGELNFRCDICDKRYCTAYKLKIHVMRHQGVRNYECSYCGQKKTTSDELKRHMNCHTKEKTLNCELCGQVFLSSGNYSRHMRIVHCGIKNYKCPHCERTFGKSETLKNHIMTHTGEKPFGCPICSKRFIQQCALKTHLKTHEKRKKDMKVE